MTASADLILVNGKVTTLDRGNPVADSIAIADGQILAAGPERDIRALASSAMKTIDLGGRRVIPKLDDSHTHLIRDGLN
jgi:predicted amidohydrolase YtcJ